MYAITPWTIVEAALGRYARDITGFTEGVFGSVGVRFNLSRTARARWVSEPVDAVRVERVNDERVRVTIRHSVRQGDRLEIAGDWNEWLPEALRQEGADRWAIDLRLAPGVYKFALRMDRAGGGSDRARRLWRRSGLAGDPLEVNPASSPAGPLAPPPSRRA
jgi:hypothetical protein